MKLKSGNLIIIFFISLICQSYTVGTSQTSGVTCQNKVQIDWKEKESKLVINILNREINTNRKNGKSILRDLCQISLPLTVPKGKRVLVDKVDMWADGDRSIDKLSTGRMNSEYYISGEEGNHWQEEFKANDKGAFHLNKTFNNLKNNLSISEDCGKDIILRLNHSLLIRKKSSLSSSLKVSFLLLEKDC